MPLNIFHGLLTLPDAGAISTSAEFLYLLLKIELFNGYNLCKAYLHCAERKGVQMYCEKLSLELRCNQCHFCESFGCSSSACIRD